jgi:tagatose-6-phosphate ketose/aldose isomerase
MKAASCAGLSDTGQPWAKDKNRVPKQVEVRYPTDSLVATEIAQQPALWPTTLERVLSAGLAQQFDGLPIILTGAGTSAYAAQAIADAWPGARAVPTTGLLLLSASEVELAVPSFAQGGWLISLARSGDSPESAAVVERIKKFFPAVRHLAIVCNAEGRLASTPGVQAICLDPRTNDRSLAMTSSFSNLVLGGLALLHGPQIAEHLPAICSRVAGRLPELNTTAETIARSCRDRVVLLASGMRALTWEASLKVVELTAGRVMAMPETFLGLRHGPLSFVREDTPVVCFASSDEGKRRYEEELIEDLSKRGLGKLAVIGDNACSLWQHDWFVQASTSALPDRLRIPFEIPFAQLLAYHLSIHAQVNPDNPSPGGAITRVVQAFNIHQEVGDA